MTNTNDDKRFDADSSTSPDVQSNENTGHATASSAASYAADDGKMICVICFNDEKGLFDSTRCNHSFHSECLNEWLKRKNSCPICRSSINESSVSEHLVDESNDREEDHYMFEIFLRVRSDNENIPTHLSFNEFLEILENEEGDGEMTEMVERLEDSSSDESSDSESSDREVFFTGETRDLSTEFTTEDLYAIFSRIRYNSPYFPNELTYEEFLGVIGSTEIWGLYCQHFHQFLAYPIFDVGRNNTIESTNQPDSTLA